MRREHVYRAAIVAGRAIGFLSYKHLRPMWSFATTFSVSSIATAPNLEESATKMPGALPQLNSVTILLLGLSLYCASSGQGVWHDTT
jgi:hypothetical protein